ncbi:ABC transporter ATP-binding protein [Metamycoplasma buccale]|uniref:ABC transporter ATP-binding protein n=1 Tax=Metamycoplasma buccale TaxID=55602 RepID=UPI00398F103C
MKNKLLNKNNLNVNENIALGLYNVSKTFKGTFQALDNITIEVKKGEFHGFIGSNGSGKTTSIRCMLGFYNDFKGKIFLNSIPSTNKEAKRKIGYIPEVSDFPKKIKTQEYLYYFACISGLKPKVAREKVALLLKEYQMDGPEFNKSPYYMSSGQKKKVMLMQSLINDPNLLILDEPAANLDPAARVDFYEALKKFHEKGNTIFISSHILAELEKYIDSYTVIEKGKVIESSTIAQKNAQQQYNYKISINKNNYETFSNLLKSLKIKFNLSKDEIFLVYLENKNAKKLLLSKMIENNIELELFDKNKQTLNEIYFNSSKSE